MFSLFGQAKKEVHSYFIHFLYHSYLQLNHIKCRRPGHPVHHCQGIAFRFPALSKNKSSILFIQFS